MNKIQHAKANPFVVSAAGVALDRFPTLQAALAWSVGRCDYVAVFDRGQYVEVLLRAR